MVAGSRVRRFVVGIDPALTKSGVLGAIGLFVLSTGYVVSHELFSVPGTTGGLYLVIVAGVVLAGVSAYRNSGLLVSWLLVLAPVSVPILYTRALVAAGTPVPVALPLSLVGTGVAGFWIPTAVVLGSVAFALGTALRWAEER